MGQRGCDNRSRSQRNVGPLSKECRHPVEAGKDKEMVSPLRFQREHNLVNQPQTSDFETYEYKVMTLYCFNPRCLW